MRRKYTRKEIASQAYLTQTDIMRLLDCTYGEARKVFQVADMIDNEKLGGYRIDDRKVRITSVCRACGIDLKHISQLIKNAEAGQGNPQLSK